MFFDLSKFLTDTLNSNECRGKFQKKELKFSVDYEEENKTKKRSKESLKKSDDSLQDFLLSSDSNYKAFLEFLRNLKSNLNVCRTKCWQLIQQFKTLSGEELQKSASGIYETFISGFLEKKRKERN